MTTVDDDFEARTAQAAQSPYAPSPNNEDDEVEQPAEAKPSKPPTPVNLNSDQLAKRLAEAGTAAVNKLLSGLGYKTAEEAQAALTEAATLKAQVSELVPKAARSEALHSTLAALVEKQLAAIPAGVRGVIEKQAGDDVERRLELLSMFQEAGVTLGGDAGSRPLPASPVTITPTAVAPHSPPTSPTLYDEWKAMQSRSPMLGDLFYQRNMVEIERSRPSGS